VFDLVTALTGTAFGEALRIVVRLAGLPVAGLPRAETAKLERRAKIQRRRQALRLWRNTRLTEWLTLIGNLDRESRLLTPRYMDRARDEQNSDAEGWRLLASLHTDLQTAEVTAAELSVQDEEQWAELWLAEQRGELLKPEELRP
jgi:hypothetical protein